MTISVAGVKKEYADGLTVAQLSDVHASKTFPGNWIAGVVDAVNAARPDLIVITGVDVRDQVDMLSCRAGDDNRV